jgi:signal transduction histidine kinase
MRTPDAMHLSSGLKSWLPRAAIAALVCACPAVLCLAADAASAAARAAREPLRSIAAILALSPTEIDAQPEAIVRGVVTMRVGRSFVIQEGDSPIWVVASGRVEADDYPAPTIERGMIVEIEGRVVAGGYAPTIIGRRTRIVGRGPVPPPVPVSPSLLSRGGDEGRRVTVRGVVHGFGERTSRHSQSIPMLLLDADGWPLSVSWQTGDRQFEPERLVDAEVQITGHVEAMRNSRGQFVAPSITVTDPDDIAILSPPPADPFAGEITPLGVLGRFAAQERTGHRVRTEGIVSYAAPGLLFLQDPSAAVRIDLARVAAAAEPPFAPGDRVQVAGFLATGRSITGLTFAVARRIGSGPAPEPEPLAVAEIARVADQFRQSLWITEPGSHDGRLVRCTGVVEAVETGPEGLTATLTSPGGRWYATLDSEPDSPARARLMVGSTVAAVGILRLDLDGARINGLIVDHPRLQRITVLARDAADIEVVQAASWWTPRRLAAALAAACAALAAATAWVNTLRRQVRSQALEMAETMRSQREAAVEFETALRERNRLAVNLHDTVLQTVTGIGYQLQACQQESARVGAVDAGRLQVASRMVTHAVEQLRGTVWALHTLPTGGESLAAGLEALAARLQEGRGVPIRCRTSGVEPTIAESTMAAILLVAQEAIVNALRHAGAAAIDVSVSHADGRVTLVVADDGRGFTLGEQPGSMHGHFGIEGMRDRMQAVGGDCHVESRPGQGTTVTAVAAVKSPDDDLSDRTGAELVADGSMRQ